MIEVGQIAARCTFDRGQVERDDWRMAGSDTVAGKAVIERDEGCDQS